MNYLETLNKVNELGEDFSKIYEPFNKDPIRGLEARGKNKMGYKEMTYQELLKRASKFSEVYDKFNKDHIKKLDFGDESIIEYPDSEDSNWGKGPDWGDTPPDQRVRLYNDLEWALVKLAYTLIKGYKNNKGVRGYIDDYWEGKKIIDGVNSGKYRSYKF